MKNIIKILFVFTLFSCKKTVINSIVDTTLHKKHGIVKINIETNCKNYLLKVLKTDTANNVVNNRILFESNSFDNYSLNSNELGGYQIYVLANNDSLVIPNSNIYIKLIAIDEYNNTLIDSTRTAATILSRKWQTGIHYKFNVK